MYRIQKRLSCFWVFSQYFVKAVHCVHALCLMLFIRKFGLIHELCQTYFPLFYERPRIWFPIEVAGLLCIRLLPGSSTKSPITTIVITSLHFLRLRSGHGLRVWRESLLIRLPNQTPVVTVVLRHRWQGILVHPVLFLMQQDRGWRFVSIALPPFPDNDGSSNHNQNDKSNSKAYDCQFL